jgi:hypothetical protein
MIACWRAARTPRLICRWACFHAATPGPGWGRLPTRRRTRRRTHEVLAGRTPLAPRPSQAAAGPCSRLCPAKDRAFRAMSANPVLAGRARAALRASRARLQAAACCRISRPRSALIVCMVTGYMASSSVAGPSGPCGEPAIWPVTLTTNRDRPDGQPHEPSCRGLGRRAPGPPITRLTWPGMPPTRPCARRSKKTSGARPWT